jgi:AcrR family transcriptional regulator
VDRIAERAGMNKRLIYVHFGDKERLFEAVVTRNLEAVVNDVPFDAADLPGYAERLFDYWYLHPEAARLFWWRNLERSATTEVEELERLQLDRRD